MYKKKLKNIVWFASTIEGMENLINNTELTMADIKVLMYFLSIIDTNNIIEIPTQKEIGVKLKISRKKVSESVNKLPPNVYTSSCPSTLSFIIVLQPLAFTSLWVDDFSI